MAEVFIASCELNDSSMLDIHADEEGDIWIVTSGEGSVMLSQEEAIKAGEYLIELASRAKGD